MKRTLAILMIVAWLAVFALFCFQGPPALGQVMNDWSPEAQKVNTRWWQEKVREGYVKIPRGRLYINGTAYTKPVVGCVRIETEGARSYPVHGNPALTGNVSSIYQMGSGPILVLCGMGAYAPEPLEVVLEGPRMPGVGCVEVEGRADNAARGGVPTGGHYFAHWSLDNWDVGFRALGGYYEDGKLVPSEGHSDTSVIEHCLFERVGTIFKSENEQAIPWDFNHIWVSGDGSNTVTLADLAAGGGWVTFYRPTLNLSRALLFKIGRYSPNQSTLVCEQFRYDCPTAKDPLLQFVEYTGEAKYAPAFDWPIEISGSAPITRAALDRDAYKVPAELPRRRWKENVVTLPAANKPPTGR